VYSKEGKSQKVGHQALLQIKMELTEEYIFQTRYLKSLGKYLKIKIGLTICKIQSSSQMGEG